MTVLKFLLIALAVVSIGGFAYVASIDVPVPQTQITKIIPNEQVFNDQ